MLSDFVDRHCSADPSCLVPLAAFYRRFLASLPPNTPQPSRAEVVSELAGLGFQVGDYRRSQHIVGLRLNIDWRRNSRGQLSCYLI